MHVNIRVYGMLRDKLPPEAKGKTTLDMPEGSTIQDVLDRLGVNTMIKASVNEELVRDLSHPLQDGDSLQLFRPVGGG